MAQHEPPFTAEAIDEQLAELEQALQMRPADQPETPDMQVFAALQHLYTPEQLAYRASLRQVRQRLLQRSQAAPEPPLPRQEPPAMPAGRRPAPIRSRRWRGGFLARQSTLVAAALIILLVGGLMAGLIFARAGNNGSVHTGQRPDAVEVRLQPTCAAQNQSCPADAPTLLSQDRAVLAQRLGDALGSAPSTVSLDGSSLIVVDLPPLKQEQETVDLLAQTGLLKILDTGQTFLTANQPVPPGSSYPAPFTGEQLDAKSIQAVMDPVTGQPEILFEFKGPARSAFADYTASHIGQYLTMTLDGIVLESAVIQSQITGQGVISGGTLTLDQAQHIAVLLRSGPLPLPLTVVSVQTLR